MNPKLFLAELAAYADEQRKLIEADCEGFSTDPAAQAERVKRAQADFRFFSKTYFPHYVKGSESAFHTWFYDRVPGLIDAPSGALINVSAPRGEAKSTLGTQLLALWCIVTGRKHFMPVVMDSWDQAATMLEAIKTELTANPRLMMDYPKATGAGRVWNAGVILTANNVKMQAFGSGKKMRGLRHGPHRPDLVFLDDIENDENVRQKAQRDKTEDWVAKTVLNLGPPDGSMDVLYLNTILHYDSVANRYHKKPRWVRVKFKAITRWPDRLDLWEQWEQLYLAEADDDDSGLQGNEAPTAAAQFYEQNKAEMERGAVVSWPTMRPLLRLMQIRAENHKAFDCEYQNDPTNDETALFTNMQYWVVPCRDWVFYGAHDPSLGRNNKGNDPMACLVGGFDREKGILDVVEARVARMVPNKQIDLIIQYQSEYNCLAWAFEAIQFQEFMRQILVARSAAEGVPVPALPVTPHSDKDLRIQGISPHVFNGLIRFRQAHTTLNTQLRHYPEADHDDGPDALEMLWKLAVSRRGGTPKIRTGRRRAPALPTPTH
ncbi:phage terminase large subunit [Ideonella paludis]|uniref:Phage terminase large subunit n=1 Tax=Ideonella paludis TaxID=1233411 RepID=A0ABS5E018_9BURK|nr:phage terminase large subunit [Ideonella paludis]